MRLYGWEWRKSLENQYIHIRRRSSLILKIFPVNMKWYLTFFRYSLSLSFSFFIPFLFSISLHLRNYLCKWSLYTIFFNYATLYSLTVLLTLVWVCFFIYLFIWVWSWMMTYYIRLNFMVWKEFMVDFFNDVMFFRRPSDGHVL